MNGGGISSGSISGGWGGQIGSGTITTANTISGINASLSNGDYAYGACNGWNDMNIGSQSLYIGGHLVMMAYKPDVGNYLTWL